MTATRFLLAVSLGLNIFIAGWWVGAQLQRGPQPQQPMVRVLSPSDFIAHRLSPQGYAAVQPLLQQLDDVMRRGFGDRAATFDELRQLASANPYDSGKVRALLATLPDKRTDSEATQWQLVADILDKLSPQDRAQFADSIFLKPGPPPGGPGPGPQGVVFGAAGDGQQARGPGGPMPGFSPF